MSGGLKPAARVVRHGCWIESLDGQSVILGLEQDVGPGSDIVREELMDGLRRSSR